MYRVIQYFTDIQDGGHPYHVGDAFPRSGAEAADMRIAELESDKNAQGAPLIEYVEGGSAGDEMTKVQIIAILEENGIEFNARATKAELFALLPESNDGENDGE